MSQHRIPMVPGPTRVAADVLKAYSQDYPSADIEESFFQEYTRCVNGLKQIGRFSLTCADLKVNTDNDIAILSGEGMVALWGALKSVLRKGDVVVSVCNGVYGNGIADMASRLGAVVHKVCS